MPASAIAAVHADPVDPMPVLEGAALLDSLPEEAVDAVLGWAGPRSGSPEVIVEIRPWSRGGMLPNFAPSADPARVARNHDADALRRLLALKTAHDPDGVLSAGAVVRPL